MRSRKFIIVLPLITALLLLIPACSLSGSSISLEDKVATKVAATMQANPVNEPVPAETQPDQAPTAPPESVPQSAGISLSFVGPDRNAYYWNDAITSPLQLTTSGDVESTVISGDRIALVRLTPPYDYSLDIIATDGSGQRTLLTPENFAAFPHPAEVLTTAPFQVSWLPGTHILAFSTLYLWEGPGMGQGNDLYLLDTNSGTWRSLLTVPDNFAWRYTYSPDYSKIAISRPEGVDIYNAGGSLLTASVMTFDFVNTASEYAWVPSPVWSADSSLLAAVIPPKEPWTENPADSKIWVVSADGQGGTVTATSMTYFPSGFASISPDLTRITYLVRTSPGENTYSLKFASINNTGVIEAASGKILSAPDWSPGSTSYLFIDQDNGLFLSEAGSTPEGIPEITNPRNIQWANNDYYVVSAGGENGWNLWLGKVNATPQLLYSAFVQDGGWFSFDIDD